MPNSSGQNLYRGEGGLTSFKATIKNVDGSRAFDVTSLVLNTTIYEDIFSKTMYGNVILKDGINLLNGFRLKPNPGTSQSIDQQKSYKAFPIVGEEYIEFEYQISTDKPIVFKRFAIYSVKDIKNNKELNMREYTVEFCSEEYLIDATTLVQKSYQQQISKSVEDVLTSYLKVNEELPNGKKKKSYDIQATKGTQNIVIPRLSPLECMDFFARRSLANTTFQSATYVFFENKDGFNFCDIEYLIKRGKDKIKNEKLNTGEQSAYTYYSQDAKLATNKSDDKNIHITESAKTFKTLLSIKQKHRFDTIEKLRRGYFESDVVVFDAIGGKTSTTTYKFLDNYTNYNALGAGPEESAAGAVYPENSLDFIKSVTQATSNSSANSAGGGFLGIFGLTKNTPAPSGKHTKVFLIPKDTLQPDTYLESIYPARASYMTRFSQNMFTAEAHGDPTIAAGDVILMSLPEVEGTTSKDGKKPDYFLSGYFMITSIQHRLTPESYHCTFDMFKNGFSQPVISTDNTAVPEAADTNYLYNVTAVGGTK
jgi:hypothetical protein